jgi:hypothetical protein
MKPFLRTIESHDLKSDPPMSKRPTQNPVFLAYLWSHRSKLLTQNVYHIMGNITFIHRDPNQGGRKQKSQFIDGFF